MFSLIDRLVGVIDDPTHAEVARQRLVALGIPAADIEVLTGEADAQRLDSTGEGGWWHRLVRVSQYMVADQSTELVMYDAALRDGRAVIAVRLKDRQHKAEATRILQEAGAHLLSFHGRIQTEEISRWRGPELVQPPVLPDRGSTSR
ncbi:MAG: hypothetical protein KF809_19035 [Chloroflexi bacterium]|nr:hypothetical protein [Chloroflexota bacterium]